MRVNLLCIKWMAVSLKKCVSIFQLLAKLQLDFQKQSNWLFVYIWLIWINVLIMLSQISSHSTHNGISYTNLLLLCNAILLSMLIIAHPSFPYRVMHQWPVAIKAYSVWRQLFKLCNALYNNWESIINGCLIASANKSLPCATAWAQPFVLSNPR